MDLILIPFPSGIRFVYCRDNENYVVTDVETETMRAEFIYLGKDDSIDNYKAIDRNTPVAEKLESEETL